MSETPIRFQANMPIVTVKLKDIKMLPDVDRHMLRFYVRGGNKEEARYPDIPEVRTILERNKIEIATKGLN